jgi:dipeptidyl aminopeptidase/acylaminoacyl peptidase
MFTIYSLSGADGKTVYFGATSKNAAYALSHHRSAAKSAKRRTPVNEWVLENEGSVVFTALEEVSEEDKDTRLEFWLSNARRSGLPILNVTKEEHAAKVKKAMSDPAVRARISENGKGRVNTPEHRKAISEANKGRVISPEHRAIISARHTGKVTSPETKAKIAAKAMGHKRNEGRVHSEAAKEKMSRTRHTLNHVDKGIVKETCRWCNPTT